MSNVKVNYKGVDFDVEFDFQPEEAQTHDYPGCPAEITITCIECKGVDFTEFFSQYGTDKEIRDIYNDFEQLIWEARADAYDPDYGMDY